MQCHSLPGMPVVAQPSGDPLATNRQVPEGSLDAEVWKHVVLAGLQVSNKNSEGPPGLASQKPS